MRGIKGEWYTGNRIVDLKITALHLLHERRYAIMARSVEFVGLNSNAKKLVAGATITEYIMPFGDDAVVGRIYQFEDGKRYTEIIQKVIWNCGPMVYTHLVDDDGNKHGEWKFAPWKYPHDMILADHFTFGIIYVPHQYINEGVKQ